MRKEVQQLYDKWTLSHPFKVMVRSTTVRPEVVEQEMGLTVRSLVVEAGLRIYFWETEEHRLSFIATYGGNTYP